MRGGKPHHPRHHHHHHAATLTALQRPPLTFGLITTTITPYGHTQPPPPSQPPSPHLYCRQPPTDFGQGVGKTTPRLTVGHKGRQQRLLLIPNTVPKHTHTDTTPLPPHSSSSATSPVNFYSKLKDDIQHNLNCVATIPV